jgi:hypothetical protein
MAYDTVPGEVVALTRPENATIISAGTIRFAYTDDDGVRREEFRRVGQSTSAFRKLEVGDRINVWVCKNDRSKVRLVGYSTHEPDTCAAEA